MNQPPNTSGNATMSSETSSPSQASHLLEHAFGDGADDSHDPAPEPAGVDHSPSLFHSPQDVLGDLLRRGGEAGGQVHAQEIQLATLGCAIKIIH